VITLAACNPSALVPEDCRVALGVACVVIDNRGRFTAVRTGCMRGQERLRFRAFNAGRIGVRPCGHIAHARAAYDETRRRRDRHRDVGKWVTRYMNREEALGSYRHTVHVGSPHQTTCPVLNRATHRAPIRFK